MLGRNYLGVFFWDFAAGGCKVRSKNFQEPQQAARDPE